MDRVQQVGHADDVTCPAEHPPPTGLNPDRETATAEAAAQVFALLLLPRLFRLFRVQLGRPAQQGCVDGSIHARPRGFYGAVLGALLLGDGDGLHGHHSARPARRQLPTIADAARATQRANSLDFGGGVVDARRLVEQLKNSGRIQ